MCCACAGMCSHTGAHSFCAAHSPSGVPTDLPGENAVTTNYITIISHDDLTEAYNAGFEDGRKFERERRRMPWRFKR